MLLINTTYRVLNVIVSFLVTIVLSRLVGVEGFGLISLLIINAAIFNLFSSFGADAGIVYHLASNRFSVTTVLRIIHLVMVTQLVLLLFVEAFSYIFSGHFLILAGSNPYTLAVILTYIISVSAIEKYSSLFNGLQLYTLCSKLMLAGNGLIFLALGILYFFLPAQSTLTYMSIFVLLTAVHALMFVFAFYGRKEKKDFAITNEPNAWKAFFGYSLITLMTNSIQFLAYRIDYWFINYYRDEKELGWYSLAVKIVQGLWIVPMVLAAIILPMVASSREKFTVDRLVALTRVTIFVSLIIGVISVIIVPWLLPFLFGHEFESSISIFFLLLPGIILFSIATLFASYYAGVNRLWVNFTGSAICLVIITVLDLILIPKQGMYGAAIASSIGYGVTGLYYATRFMAERNIRIYRLFIPVKEDFTFLRSILQRMNKRTEL